MRILPILSAAALLLLVPSPAWAWGPAAHLEFGRAVLADLALVAPAAAALLARFSNDFLYGSIAADITIGKNLSPYHLHCHNWQVGFTVLELAERDDTRAFAWGYLAHLAADTVAHNYFVPYKLVEHYRRRGATHAYWELRFDARLRQRSGSLARALPLRGFARHDRHLRHILTGPLFPFPVNKQLFNGMVLVTRLLHGQPLETAYSRRWAPPLQDEEVTQAREMSLSRVRDLLKRGAQADCLRADPTGHRNLLLARELRRRLRAFARQQRLLQPEEVGRLFRPLFAAAVEDKLELPSLESLLDPSKPARTRRAARGILNGRRPNGKR